MIPELITQLFHAWLLVALGLIVVTWLATRDVRR
jgi:hypothetical protein